MLDAHTGTNTVLPGGIGEITRDVPVDRHVKKGVHEIISDAELISRAHYLTDYLTNFVLKFWNSEIDASQRRSGLAKIDLDLKLSDNTSFKLFEVRDQMFDAFVADGANAKGYALFPNTIRAVQENLMALRAGDLMLYAPTQSGKTLIQIMTAVFFSLDQQRRHEQDSSIDLYVPFLIASGRVSAHTMIDRDFSRFLQIHSSLRLLDDPTMTLQSANARRETRHTYRRTSETTIDELIAATKKLGARGMLLQIDEADEGTQSKSAKNLKGGIMARWLEAADQANIKIKFMLTSATDQQYESLPFHRVEFKPDPKAYTGLLLGQRLNVQSFSNVAKRLKGVSALFEDEWNATSPRTAKALGRLCEQLARGVLDDKLGLNGRPFNGGLHIAARAAATIEDADELVKNLKRNSAFQRSGMVPVCFYDEHGLDDVESLYENPPHKHMLVIFVGGARRAERFPPENAIFLDFTREYSNQSSYEQGFVGRATGYGKTTKLITPFVLVSDANYEHVENTRFIYDAQKGLRTPVLPVTRALNVGKAIAHRKMSGVDANIYDHPALASVIRRISARIEAAGVSKVTLRKSKKTGKMMPTIRHLDTMLDIFGSFILEEDIIEIEKGMSDYYNAPVEMLRPGQEREHDAGLACDAEGRVYTSARNTVSNRNGSMRGQHNSVRYTKRTTILGKPIETDDGRKRVSITLGYHIDAQRKFRVVSIYFPLAKSIRPTSIGDYLPSPESYLFDFLPRSDRDRVIDHISAKSSKRAKNKKAATAAPQNVTKRVK